jgi:hypothetical protein
MIGGGVLALAGLVYASFGGDDTPTHTTATTHSKDKSSIPAGYAPEDFQGARFANYTEPPKDAFLPAISKAGPTAGTPSGLDAAWAGGEVGWAYTGYVVFDGKPQALLENSNTSDGMYVAAGQPWKTSTIEKITPDTLVLATKTGPHTVKLGEGGEQKGKKDVMPAVAPADPQSALQGPIGNNPAVAQVPTGALPDVAAPVPMGQGQMFQGGGRRGFGGRGRRGGGGGGFAGGG